MDVCFSDLRLLKRLIANGDTFKELFDTSRITLGVGKVRLRLFSIFSPKTFATIAFNPFPMVSIVPKSSCVIPTQTLTP